MRNLRKEARLVLYKTDNIHKKSLFNSQKADLNTKIEPNCELKRKTINLKDKEKTTKGKIRLSNNELLNF